MAEYKDTSYPAISDALRYERGDGAIVRLQITPPDKEKTVSANNSQPRAISGNVAKTVRARASVPLSAEMARALLNPATTAKERPQAAVVDRPRVAGAPAATNDLFANDAVGEKFTAFILFYGGEEYYDLHKRCLESFLATTPRERVDLRVGSNQLNKRSADMLNEHTKSGVITKHYQHTDNAYKYPVMREMFFDKTCPITTKWVLWFDDDSVCDADPNWLTLLSMQIRSKHKPGKNDAHMIGAIYHYYLNDNHKAIFKSRPWYKDRPWRDTRGRPAPNGSRACFVVGGFWALTHEAIVAADIPDLGTGLTHNGGDWQIGEQLYQAGYGMCQFNGKKQFVRTSSVPRRGVTMPTIDKASTSREPPTATTKPPVLPRLPRLSET